jgi:hypothetical protein
MESPDVERIKEFAQILLELCDNIETSIQVTEDTEMLVPDILKDLQHVKHNEITKSIS